MSRRGCFGTGKDRLIIEDRPVTHIQDHDNDNITCICGNTTGTDGFFPCDPTGKIVEPEPQIWLEGLYTCAACGLIFDGETGRIRPRLIEGGVQP